MKQGFSLLLLLSGLFVVWPVQAQNEPDSLLEWIRPERLTTHSFQNLRLQHRFETRRIATHETDVEAHWAGFVFIKQPGGELLIREDTAGELHLDWRNIGFNASGRILSHAFDPYDSRILWVGSASGGLWKTTNAGKSWRPMTDHLPAMVISTVVVHPQDSQTLLIGTIDNFGDEEHQIIRGEERYGFGVLRTDDGGQTWHTTSLFDATEPMDCNQLVWNPHAPQQVYLAASNGVWWSSDAGKNWQRVLKGDAKTLVINKQAPEILYVGLSASEGPGYHAPGVYQSTDGGMSWRRLVDGLPAVQEYRDACGICMQLAISDGFPEVLFFFVQAQGADWLYKTEDGGETWRVILTAEDLKVLQRMWMVSVSPVDPDVVFLGGVRLFRSRRGGIRGTWKEVGLLKKYDPLYVRNFPGGSRLSRAKYDSLKALPPTRSLLMRLLGSWIHVDHHDVGFDPGDPGTVYDFSDGGVYRSTDGGDTWSPRNDSLMTLQLYALDVSPHDAIAVAAGAQDQGQLFLDPGHYIKRKRAYSHATPRPYWRKWLGGDAMIPLFHHSDENILYGTSQNGNHWRLTIPADGFVPLLDRVNRTQTGIHGSRGSSKATGLVRGTNATNFWVTPKVMHPTIPQIMFTATYDSIYTTAWKGGTIFQDNKEQSSLVVWENVARIDSVSVLAIDRKNPAIVYAYSDKKNAPAFWRAVGDSTWWQRGSALVKEATENPGWLATPWWKHWEDSTLWHVLRTDSIKQSLDSLLTTFCESMPDAPWPFSWPAPFLSDLEADPDTEGTLYATRADYCHQVWRSTDGGETWNDITNNLADVEGKVPVTAIAITPESTVHRKQLYLATVVGVFMAYDNPEAQKITWRRVHGKLPHVVASDIHFHPVDRTIRVATYGRGYWKAKVPAR
ncbi:MAG: hypothetical protein ACE5G0_02955 [Rhodothermales bacterium]